MRLTFSPNVLPCLEWLARHFHWCILRQCGLCLVFDNKRFSFLLGSVLAPHGLRLSLLDDALIYGLLRVVLTPYYFTSFQGLTAGNYTPLSKWFFGVFSPRPLSVLSLFSRRETAQRFLHRKSVIPPEDVMIIFLLAAVTRTRLWAVCSTPVAIVFYSSCR